MSVVDPKVLIPRLRKLIPQLMAQEIVGVQPMNYVEPPARNRIHHWRFEDGETCPNPGMPEGRGRLDPPPRGWYCWMYPANDNEFSDWMKQCCPSAEVIHRFNSGDPMWTVYISDEREAMLFKLKWST